MFNCLDTKFMEKMDLEASTSYEKLQVKPVTLSDGTVVEMSVIKDEGRVSLTGTARKDETTVGTVQVNPDGNRLFIQVLPLNAVDKAAVKEMVEVFAAGIELALGD